VRGESKKSFWSLALIPLPLFFLEKMPEMKILKKGVA